MALTPDGKVKDFTHAVLCKKCRLFLISRHKPDGTTVIECQGCSSKSTLKDKDHIDTP